MRTSMIALLAIALGVMLMGIGEPPVKGVPAGRLAALAKGVNLSHWIWLPHGAGEEGRRAFITPRDLAMLREAGVTHVRLPFEPERVWDHQAHSMRGEGLAELRRCIELCLESGLAVVVEAHAINTERTPWIAPGPDGRFVELERFWGALAGELAGFDPERVFLEVLNEPHGLADRAVWPAAQVHLVRAIRAAAPRHTIVVTGDDYGGIDGLLRLAPLADRNVVYSFHFYEPHNFTHQGATWGWRGWRHLRGVPYPATPEEVEGVAESIKDEQAAGAVRQYGKERWNAARIGERIGRAAAWGAEHGVPVYCGEFGAYAAVTPRESRVAWLRDTAAALNGAGIGWAMWDYAGGFALAPGEPGVRELDREVAGAIGLRTGE